ncbi:MAG: AAA family ATPase [Bacteroidaceae bacterium]|nr:AAA family ATPase [Bacteroidaceae bacterium]
MIAVKYLNSRLGKTIEQIKKAYLSNKNICFLVCNEPEFIKDIISSTSLFPNLKPEADNVQRISNISFTNPFNYQDFKSLPVDRPYLYVCDCLSIKEDKDLQNKINELEKYVSFITDLSTCHISLNEEKNKKIEYIKRSLILFLVDSKPKIPSYMEHYAETIVVPFMNELEFKEYVSLFLKNVENVKTIIADNGYEVVTNDDYLTRLYRNMLCLNATQIRSILIKNKMLLGNIYYEKEQNRYEERIGVLLKNIKQEFEKLLDQSRALTLEETSSETPAGLENITKWIEESKESVKKEGNTTDYMVRSPKGMIVTGVPGTGKSMMAKYIAHALNLTLVRFDIGNVGGNYVGDSEKNMDKALGLIDTLTQCLLWLDEIEKAFPNKNKNTHETSEKVFGKFLFWLQEKCSCFVFATSNDVSKLPSELFRNGRFDAKYFTFMPSAEDCSIIFDTNIKQQNKKYKETREQTILLFDTTKINGQYFKELIESEICLRGPKLNLNYKEINRLNKFFIGADISQLIETSKVLYFHKYGKELSDKQKYKYDSDKFKDCIRDTLKNLKTYGETNLEDIAKCYALLVTNNFNPASQSSILPFEGYDELNYNVNLEIARSNGKPLTNIPLYKLNNEEEHFNNKLKSPYDKCLYIIIRNVINGLAQQIINERRNK